jgi:hypothetical protein
MPLFVLYLYKASSYLAICRNDCHLQIGCYQAHAIASCVERPTRKVVLKDRLEKWMFALSEFDIQYQPTKAVKGQALADLIAERINTDIAALSMHAWTMYFDRSACGVRQIGLWGRMWYRYPARVASGGSIFFFNQVAYPLHQQFSKI